MASEYHKPKRIQLSTNWNPFYPVNPNQDMSYYLDQSQIEAQALYSTTTEGKMLVDALVKYIVGTGLTPMASPETALLGWNEDTVRRFQSESEAYFRRVVNCPNFDWYGKNTFSELQRIGLRTIIINGDTLCHRTYIKTLDGIKPCLQLISGRMVSQGMKQDVKGCAGGVVFDEAGREKGYFIRVLDNSLNDSGNVQYVDRYNRKTGKLEFDLIQLGQAEANLTRGIPWLAPLRDEILGLSKYSQNHLMQSMVDTLFTLFITSENQTADTFRQKIGELGGKEDVEDDRVVNMGSGSVVKLEPGEKPAVIERSVKGDDYATYVQSNINRMAAAFGMNSEVAMGDFKASFSAAKGSLAVAEKTFEIYRDEFARKFCEPVWRQVVECGILDGSIHAPGYTKHRDAILAVTWTGVTAPMIDPSKEIGALIDAVNAGLIDRETVTRTLFGKDFDEVQERRQMEDAMLPEQKEEEKNEPTE